MSIFDILHPICEDRLKICVDGANMFNRFSEFTGIKRGRRAVQMIPRCDCVLAANLDTVPEKIAHPA